MSVLPWQRWYGWKDLLTEGLAHGCWFQILGDILEELVGDALKGMRSEELRKPLHLINFWATWCPPCLAELPSIQNLHNRFKNDDRVVFMMVDVDHKINESTTFLLKRSFDLPVYSPGNIPDQAVYDGTLPTTLILDKEGKALLHHSGIGRYDTPSIIQLLENELNQ